MDVKGTILLLQYMNDMIITSDDLNGIQELKDFLSQQFKMKDLGHLSYFLALEITHSTDGLYITQAKYTSELLSRVGLIDSKTVDTSVELNAHLTPSGGKSLFNPSLYIHLVGSPVYLIVTRPDISYAVHQVSQYLSTPQSTHYVAVLHILRYLKGNLFYGLFYSAQSPLVLRAFSDANQAGDPTNRRSTISYFFLLGFLWFIGEAKNKLMWPAPILKQNIVPLLIPHLSSFDYDGFSKTQVCPHPLLLLFIVTTRVLGHM